MESLRNGYKVYTRGWPLMMIQKEGQPDGVVFIRSGLKRRHRNPATGFTKHQRTMIEWFKGIGVRVILL